MPENIKLYTEPIALSPPLIKGNIIIINVITFPPPTKKVKKYWLAEIRNVRLAPAKIPGNICGRVT